MKPSIERNVALVTGAGGGIGRAIAFGLAEAGFDLILNGLDDDKLAETRDGINQRNAAAACVVADISDLSGHEKLLDEACQHFGTPTCLVNNAGISVACRGDILEVAPESFDRLMAVNLRGPFFLTQKLAVRMLKDHRSTSPRTIVTVSSANAYAASLDRAEYCISKSGLSMMTKLLAIRLASAGINVYEIQPGVIRTAMTAVAQERYDSLYETGDFTPINRWGAPSEVGRAAVMLATGKLPFSTGEVIHVDGGLHISRL